MKKFCSLILCFLFLFISIPVSAEEEPIINISSPSVILMEAQSGTVIYEKNSNQQLPPASVTKIMTLLITMEAIAEGKITMDDMVPISKNAQGIEGTTIFLEAGELMSVHDLIKGISIASANDACIAISEYIAGSEGEFVRMMNNRAKELGMNNTNFVNPNGLDNENHLTTAHDIALMSRELIKYEEIFDFTTIWLDYLRDGKTELANTNKLLNSYHGINGLKTGSTSKALFCLSATAKRDDMQLIAVVMAAPTSNERFSDAAALLDYGFANYRLSKIANVEEVLGYVPVLKGTNESVAVACCEPLAVLVNRGRQNEVTNKIELFENLQAPVKKGDKAGVVKFYLDKEFIGEIPLVATEDVERKTFIQSLSGILKKWFLGGD